MIIRKLFKFEGAHIVRGCSSERCSKSLHGHSYKVEVFLTSDGLDNGQMVLDFGLLKGPVKDLIDSFDHAYSFWDADLPELKNFVMEFSNRWISMPVSPSAESYAVMFFYVIDKMLRATQFKNGEKSVKLHSVRVHETDTGYAEAFESDLSTCWRYPLQSIEFSDGIKVEWGDSEMYQKLIDYHRGVIGDKPFVNPQPQKFEGVK